MGGIMKCNLNSNNKQYAKQESHARSLSIFSCTQKYDLNSERERYNEVTKSCMSSSG